MVELLPAQHRAALSLFSQKRTHWVARSACLGLVECRIFADDATSPTAAVLTLARFGIAFAAGDAAFAAPLLEALRGIHPWFEISDPPERWHPALAAWSKESYATMRYAFSNDPGAFDLERLERLAVPPDGCQVKAYDAQLVRQALSAGWSEDQTGAFLSGDDFLKNGLGMALLQDGQLAAGCTSFCRHEDGYEVQVDTHPDHRGKGYATCISAAFILNALRRGRTPYWDAANRQSLRLAEKLGYAFTRAFPAWLLISPAQSAEEVAQKVIGTSSTEG